MKLEKGNVFNGRFELVEEIGRGGFSVVWMAKDGMANGMEVALKIYAHEQGLDRHSLEQFRKEYVLAAGFNHPGLLKANYFDVFDGSPFLVMPYCKNGSLGRQVMRGQHFSEQGIAKLLQQVSEALTYLHKKDTVHQDIKPDNILIDNEGNYVLTDFGISSRLRTTLRKTVASPQSLTMAYSPPERFKGVMKSGTAGDIFALGVVIFELATGDVPWMGAGGSILSAESELPQLPDGYSRQLESLMKRCLAYDPTKRPKAEEVSESAQCYLRDGHWERSGKDSGRRTEPKPRGGSGEPSTHTKDPDNLPKLLVGGGLILAIFLVVFFSRGVNGSIEFTSLPEGAALYLNGSYKGTTPVVVDDLPLGHYDYEFRKQGYETITSKAFILEHGITAKVFERLSIVSTAEPIEPEMIFVEGGTFTMGCTSEQGDCEDDEKPAHRVTLSSFQIGKYEVTQAQWRAVMGNNPSQSSGCDACPVENVSWVDIQDFLRKLNQQTGKAYRLPSEAEWEYAARGGNRSRRYMYAGSNDIGKIAWHWDIGGSKRISPVGRKEPNELGIYDMSGNVWEWCGDWYGRFSEEPQINPTGGSVGEYRVLRGGSWDHFEWYSRVSNRDCNYPDFRISTCGFRLVLS